MPRPHEIVRRKDLYSFIPYGKTQLDELIHRGLLKTVKLSPGGRAVGITMTSIVAYQRDHMGLEPVEDDVGHVVRSDPVNPERS
jgi:hypothetical protein